MDLLDDTDDTRIVSKIGPDLRPSSRLKYLAIVDAARAEFLDKGFAAANMDVIAESANVSKRTVYKHFEDKQALFAAVVQLLCERVAPPTLGNFRRATSGPQEVLTRLGIHFLTSFYTQEQIELFRVVVTDARRFPELGKLMFQQVARTERLLSGYLMELHAQGVIRLPCPEIAASQFLGLLKTDVQMKLLFGEKKRVTKTEIERIAECCVAVFLNGCARKSC